MACDIAHGRAEQCKDSISGIDAVYFINHGQYDPDTDISYNGTNTDLIDGVNGVTSLYKFELKGANSFEQTWQSSRENGTTFVEQTLTVQLKKQDVQMHKTAKLLAYGRPNIVVRTRTNQFFLAGLRRGMDVTAGTASTGTQMGDFNGYSFTFTGQENMLANFLDCTNEATLSSMFNDAVIVES